MVNTANVSTAKPKKGGAIWKAPKGTALPEDATTSLNAAFVSLGYISEDGLSNTLGQTFEQIKAWGGDVVDNTLTEKTITYGFTMIEALNTDVLKSVYGEKNVTGTIEDGITVNVDLEEQEECSWVVEMILKGGVLQRIVIPSAKITELGDVSYNDTNAIGYSATLTPTPDNDGYYCHNYIKKSA